MQTYFNTWHDKQMPWPESGGVYIPTVDGRFASPQQSLEKGLRYAAFFAAQQRDAYVTHAPCMYSRPDCHTRHEVPVEYSKGIGPTADWKTYKRIHGLGTTYM
jgi:hypothetical protein